MLSPKPWCRPSRAKIRAEARFRSSAERGDGAAHARRRVVAAGASLARGLDSSGRLAGAHRRALNRRDDGGLGCEEANGLVVEMRAINFTQGRFVGGEVGAGAEMFALRAKHDGATSVVRVESLDAVGELADERLIEVVRGWLLDLYGRDEVVADLDLQIFVPLALAHASFLGGDCVGSGE